MLPTGELQSLTGRPILDDGGAQLLVNPSAGPLQIAKNGAIVQNGRQVGTIGLFTIDPAARLSRFDTSGVIPDRPAEPVVDFSSTGVMQGYVERANVNPVMEMTNLISVSRSFDAVTTALTEGESTLRDAIQALGSTQR
jgi:flagellar basal-body rod protein FlgF